MNYSKILYYDTGNCHGLSTTIWLSGCNRNCPECFNSEIFDHNYGNLVTEEVINRIVNSLQKPQIKYFVVLGGEPLDDINRKITLKICKMVREKTNVEIIVYTGYTIDKIFPKIVELHQYIDRIIDGPYQKDKATEFLELRGSTNQKCYRILYNKDKMCYNYIEDKDYFRKE